jgi:hypothetical protein
MGEGSDVEGKAYSPVWEIADPFAAVSYVARSWLCVYVALERVSHRGVLVLLVLVLRSRCDNNRRVLF